MICQGALKLLLSRSSVHCAFGSKNVLLLSTHLSIASADPSTALTAAPRQHRLFSADSTPAAGPKPTTPPTPTHPSAQHPTTAPDEPTVSSASILQKYISQELVTDVSSTVNRLTGYEGIDRLKARVATVDEALTDCKRQLQAAKLAYDQQLDKQGQLHREVTALLQRKSSWVPADVARFTQLYAAEHETEQAVAAAKARYTGLSDDVELLQLKLVDLIRERYQQEQAWSDKIRRASTWWTWGLMGLHFASFVAVYTFLEPRKRQALTAAVSTMLQQQTASIDERLAHLSQAVPAGSQEQQAAESSRQVPAGQAGQQQLQASVEVQQQVLQELQKVQQQLQALTQQQQQQQPAQAGTPPSSTPRSDSSSAQLPGLWQQLPGRQWVSQQVAAASAAVGRSWQAVKSSSRLVSSQFNPMHTLGGQGPAAAGQSGSSAGSAADGASTVTQHQQQHHHQQGAEGTQQQQQLAQGAGSKQPQAADAQSSPAPPSAASGSRGSRSVVGLLRQMQLGGGVVEVTRGQLATLAAAASTCGAAVGAVLVVLLRPGGGAAGSTAR